MTGRRAGEACSGNKKVSFLGWRTDIILIQTSHMYLPASQRDGQNDRTDCLQSAVHVSRKTTNKYDDSRHDPPHKYNEYIHIQEHIYQRSLYLHPPFNQLTLTLTLTHHSTNNSHPLPSCYTWRNIRGKYGNTYSTGMCVRHVPVYTTVARAYDAYHSRRHLVYL